MEFLYLDESGQFEGTAARQLATFVGGFVTTISPERLIETLQAVHGTVRADPEIGKHLGPEPGDLHGMHLLAKLSPEAKTRLRQIVLEQLRELEGFRLVSTHYFQDADVLVGVNADHRAFNRYLRTWQATVRSVLLHAPWPGSELTIFTAQRTIPADLVKHDAELIQSFNPTHLADGTESRRVLAAEQLPNLLRGLDAVVSSAPFPRRLVHAQVGAISRVTWDAVRRAPFLAGLLLADLACDLVRVRSGLDPEESLAESLGRVSHFRIAYDPRWSRYERLAETACLSERALEELVSLAVAPAARDAVDQWLREAAGALVDALLVNPDRRLRHAIVKVAQGELDAKPGVFPKCERIFAGLRHPGAPTRDNWKEHAARLAFENHTGRTGDRRQIRNVIAQLGARDVDFVLAQAEDVSHVAVSARDEFDFDTAVELVEGLHGRLARVLEVVAADGRWTVFGRVASNLAQNYAFRQGPGDLDRAVALYRDVRRHFTSPGDLGQWACHAANLAFVVGADALRDEALTHLFGGSSPEHVAGAMLELEFPAAPHHRIFDLVVGSRAAALGVGGFRQALGGRVERLLRNVAQAKRSHPLELYARHLLEIAPTELEEQLLALALDAFHGSGAVIAAVEASGTLAAYAAKLFATRRDAAAVEVGRRIVPTFRAPFEASAWASPSTYAPELESGWFWEAVRGLEEAVTPTSVAAFLERFRYEWR